VVKVLHESAELRAAKSTKILYGAENAVGMGVKFMSNVKKMMDITFDSRGPSIVVEVAAYWNGYLDIIKRGGEIRIVTEITPTNLHYCKQLSRIAEVRHLNGMIGGIAVNETEYMATTTLEEAKPLTQVIYSNVNEVVRQGHCLFQSLWQNAVPGEDRIREIEEGVEAERTQVVYGADQVLKFTLDSFSKIKETFDSCMDSDGPSIVVDNEALRTAYSKLKDRGVKLRFLTEITPANISYCKELTKIAEVRHLEHVKGTFGISDKRLYAASGSEHREEVPSRLIVSTIRVFVEQQQYSFDTLWEKTISAEQRFRQIEDSREPEYIETISNPNDIQRLGLDVMRMARSEIRIIFSTANAFLRQVHAGGSQQLIAAAKKYNLRVRILTPFDRSIEEASKNLEAVYSSALHPEDHKRLIHIRHIEPSLQTKITLLIADAKFSLAVELQDDTKETISEATGLATLSNSKATVSSYISMFESMWRQTELHERLRANSKMQQEFINIAAHELRSPIQPIIGLSDLLLFKTRDEQQRRLLTIIMRNAKRLQKLAENILDVTKIESQTLRLNKQVFSLRELVEDTVQDYRSTQEYEEGKIQLFCHVENNDDILVEADKEKTRQVICNLLSNAFRFTKKGIVYVKVARKKMDDGRLFSMVSIKDTGSGIEPEMIPVMFEKFVTSSEKGTGLGLFISKGIVEAHGGRIWGQNNSQDGHKDGRKGATFIFTLPINNP
jgi:two-component system sensor histidine kinase VicK